MKRLYSSFASVLYLLLYVVACNQSPTDANPDVIGGETKLELTQIGGEFPVYIVTNPVITDLNRLENSTVITDNQDGIVTFYHHSTFDSVFIDALDTALGMQSLPKAVKLPILAEYAKRIGAKLDTTDKSRMTLTAEFKVKITSEGIQEFFGKNNNLTTPHTLVKYNWSVGNVYEFTNTEGIKVKRTVVSKSSEDDYSLSHLKIKVIKIDETKEDPLIEKITYIANQTYGLIGIIITSKNGKQIKLTVFPVHLF